MEASSRARGLRRLVYTALGPAVIAAGLASAGLAPGTAAASQRADSPSPLARGPHVSGVVRYQPHAPSSTTSAAATSCSRPGSGNYVTDCASTGRPVNETTSAYDPSTDTIYAAANDYNSYNGQGQNGFYWSTDGGATWNDAGPIDVFPHNTNNGAGDPGLAVDSSGVVYYSSLLFNYNRCNVGGVELLRRDPSTGGWSYYQIAGNSQSQFQDKPAITLSGSSVYESWTQFGSCSGSNVASPIKVAQLAQGGASVAPTAILTVPGSTYSQGSTLASDGSGGFWVAWEEFPSATAATGSIRLAHYTGTGWATLSNGQQWETISEGGFTDLPSPLTGFSFRDNSFPQITVAGSAPEVVWASYDNNVGRVWLWDGSPARQLTADGSDGDQFFPSIAAGGTSTYVSYSQVNAGTSTYDQWMWSSQSGTAKVSTASSDPSQDAFFSGQFIGDYNQMTFAGSAPVPIWTDIRGADPNYSGWQMDSMVESAAGPPVNGGNLSVGVTPGTTKVRGRNYQTPLTATVGWDGSPLSGASVTFTVYPADSTGCSTNPVASGSGTTTADGTVTYNFTTKTAGSYCADALASYSGQTASASTGVFPVPSQ